MLKKIAYSLIPLFVIFFAAEMGLRFSDWPSVPKKFEHNEPFWTVDPNLEQKSVPHNEAISHKERLQKKLRDLQAKADSLKSAATATPKEVSDVDKQISKTLTEIEETRTHFLVSTNEHGLRTSVKIEDLSDQFKIMTLGCSTTYGWGVNDAESYPARLQHYINEANIDNTLVINGGQPGYTSFQGLWLWEETLKLYKPDVVLIGFVVQDARQVAYTDKSQAILQRDNRFLKDNFLYRSKVYLAMRNFIGSIQIQAKEDGQVYRVPPADYVDNLREFVAKIKEMGSTPVLFGYPLEVSGYTAEHRKILRAAADELDILHFDPQPDMEEASKKQRLYFIYDQGHANASGNDVIAQWFFSFLQEKNLLGGG